MNYGKFFIKFDPPKFDLRLFQKKISSVIWLDALKFMGDLFWYQNFYGQINSFFRLPQIGSAEQSRGNFNTTSDIWHPRGSVVHARQRICGRKAWTTVWNGLRNWWPLVGAVHSRLSTLVFNFPIPSISVVQNCPDSADRIWISQSRTRIT